MSRTLHPALAMALRIAQTIWYRTMLYLPIVLIVLMALGTWWLARNTLGTSAPDTPAAARQEPDYYMRNFAVKNFDAAGVLHTEIAGAMARHLPATDVLEIDNARINAYKEGRLTVATATRAYSNGDGSEVQLVGNALVVREGGVGPQGQAYPRMEFRGEFLHAFLNTQAVKSHKPVTLLRGKDQFVADSLDYNNLDRVVVMQGRVKGTLSPRN